MSQSCFSEDFLPKKSVFCKTHTEVTFESMDMIEKLEEKIR